MYFKDFVFDLTGSKLNPKSFSYRKKTSTLSILTLYTPTPMWKSRGGSEIGIKTGVPEKTADVSRRTSTEIPKNDALLPRSSHAG